MEERENRRKGELGLLYKKGEKIKKQNQKEYRFMADSQILR